ncbi:MAG: enoyl-CoA hydratase-related protein, partial [Limnobacter sp.]|nr:enoyl-CoA hydratase-related protein [Limnobacter sp.]
MTEAVVLEQVEHGVATLTLNRPQVKNAMNGEMIETLIEAFDRLGKSDEVRSIVLAA